jgi:PHP family Zn ribbon phosphoesterase
MKDQYKLNKELSTMDKKKVKYMKNPKMIRKMIKIYNSTCKKCKNLMTQNPKRPMSDYCEECRDMMERVYDK